MSKDAASFDALPDDVATLQQQLLHTRSALAHTEAVLAETAVTCEAQQAHLAKLQAELELLKRYVFGRKSERHVPDPRQGLLPLGDEPQEPPVVPVVEEEITYRRRKGHGWSKLPEHIERQEFLLDVPESERQCACCGQAMEKIGEDRSERVEIIPARVFVKQIVRPKYACTCGQGGVKQTPAPPAPVPGGRFDFGFVAHVVTSKTADHLPLYRQQDILARSGLELSRATLCAIMAAAAELGAPLAGLMTRRLLAANLLGADDTPVRLLDSTHPNGVRLARFWLFRGFDEPGCLSGQAPTNDAPYNVFHFHESRGRDGPSKFLEGFRGTVKVDAYGVDSGVYLGSGGRIIASCCWAHARRKFDEAKGTHAQLACEALAYFQQLYDIEDRARDDSPEERRALRQTEAKPVLARFRVWLDGQAAQAVPKLKIGEAIGYVRNQWSALANYLDDGRVPIDNNATERDLRALTIGRKNWLFVGSPQAGPRAAVLYTLVASAARHDLDVWAYLCDVFERLAVFKARAGNVPDGAGLPTDEARSDEPPPREGPIRSADADPKRTSWRTLPTDDELTPLLPDVWAKTHPEAIRSYRQHERDRRASDKRSRRDKRRALAQARAVRKPPG